jgi:hypothetical protein
MSNPNFGYIPAAAPLYPLPASYRACDPFSLRCVLRDEHRDGCSGLPLIVRRGFVMAKDVPGLRKGEICLPIR